MKISQHIAAWLRNPVDYDLGLAIYNKIKINNSFDKFFLQSCKIGSPQHNLLKAEIQSARSKYALNPNLDIEINISSVNNQNLNSPKASPLPANNNTGLSHVTELHHPSKSIQFTDNPFVDISKLPEEFQEEYQKIKDYWPQLAAHQEKMRNANSNEERKLQLEKAQKLETLIKNSWNIINVFVEANPDVLKPEAKENPVNKKEQIKKKISSDMKSLTNAKRNLQRSTKQLREGENLTAKKRDKLRAKIKEFTDEIARLEIFLKS